MSDAPFMLNLSNATVSRVYAAFKMHHKLPLHFPISDSEREKFEELFMFMRTQDNFYQWVEEYTSILRPSMKLL